MTGYPYYREQQKLFATVKEFWSVRGERVCMTHGKMASRRVRDHLGTEKGRVSLLLESNI